MNCSLVPGCVWVPAMNVRAVCTRCRGCPRRGTARGQPDPVRRHVGSNPPDSGQDIARPLPSPSPTSFNCAPLIDRVLPNFADMTQFCHPSQSGTDTGKSHEM